MTQRTKFIPYRPKTILNKSSRPDHWFWARYSAYPYIGCQHGCAFCYCRERKYAPYDDPQDFAHVIKVKLNAAELLRKSLGRVPVDLVFTGDYQPAERKFGLSRKMLEVCCELAFPVFVLERSPLVLRDLDVLQSIQAKAPSVVAFSMIAAPDTPSEANVRQLERLAPRAAPRLAAMEKIAQAGIVTGTCAMPLLPGLADDQANLEALVRCTADHGGTFVLAGSLTLSDVQRDFFLDALKGRHPELLGLYDTLYPPGSYAPAGDRGRHVARMVRELCTRHGISDRIPRPVIPGDKRERNRRLAEWLANQAYALELDSASARDSWVYRRASWAVEDLQQDILMVYQAMGVRGLESLRDLGQGMAPIVERWLADLPPPVLRA